MKYLVAVCLVLVGCVTTTPEGREYRHVDEVSMLREQWIQCVQERGVLYTRDPQRRYEQWGGIRNAPAKSIHIWDARNTTCLK